MHGGAFCLASHEEVKRFTHEVCTIVPRYESQSKLRWPHVSIIFNQDDHPTNCMGAGTLPLVVFPIINNITVSKMLVDGGSSINLISASLMEKLQISEAQLLPMSPFQGVSSGVVQPLDKLVCRGFVTAGVTMG